MRFLFNMNLPRELARRLAATGHECRHAGDFGMAEASDREIVEEARAQKETIITHDLDYGDLLAFSGESVPSVVILRCRNTHPDSLFRRITASWPEIQTPLSQGAIVVLEDAALRIRRLPISERD